MLELVAITARCRRTGAKKVWRISASSPMGAWLAIHPAHKADPVPVRSQAISSLLVDEGGHWLMSSFDLLAGAEVSEDPATVPDDLFNELFAPRQDDPKAARG
jgi:hypothetical protein